MKTLLVTLYTILANHLPTYMYTNIKKPRIDVQLPRTVISSLFYDTNREKTISDTNMCNIVYELAVNVTPTLKWTVLNTYI